MRRSDWFFLVLLAMVVAGVAGGLYFSDSESDRARRAEGTLAEGTWSVTGTASDLAGNTGAAGAPVVYEDRPSHPSLFGKIEHRALFGALVTDFTMIKAGALHRANGGTILLDARALLTEPFSWPALKRALSREQITIEDPGAGEVLVRLLQRGTQPTILALGVEQPLHPLGSVAERRSDARRCHLEGPQRGHPRALHAVQRRRAEAERDQDERGAHQDRDDGPAPEGGRAAGGRSGVRGALGG